jgi:Family of unknown function (DUF6644)
MMALSLLPAFEWMESSGVGQAIQHSALLIALLESVHLVGLTLLLGTILMVDLSLLGHGIGRTPVALLARELRGWTLAGFVILFTSGPLLLTSEALRCYKSPVFWMKMTLLVFALTYHFSLHNTVALADPPAPVSRAHKTAWLSLALWTSVALAAKGIAIFQTN